MGGIQLDFNKKINKHGAVSIPAALRRSYGIEPGEKLNIQVSAEGDIVMKRTEGSCLFCGSDEGLKIFQGRQICKSCAQSIYESQVKGS